MRAISAIGTLLLAIGAFSGSGDSHGSQSGSSASSQRTLVESDFYWDAATEPHKDIIIRGVNMVHRDNTRCRTIDASSAYISSSRGSTSNPVFFVTCGSGANAFNVFFSKSDVESNAPMLAIAHISRSAAIDACENYAKVNASHPSTVSFSRVMNLSVSQLPNGRTSVDSKFTAKNSFGLELTFDIRCLFDGNSFLEGTIRESM